MIAGEALQNAHNVLIIAIDNPHLCLGRRIGQYITRLTEWLPNAKITVCDNMEADLSLPRGDIPVIPIVPLGPVADETEFVRSFAEFEKVPLLKQTRMPISGLDLFDVAGYDGLIYPYRVACELDWSGLDDLNGPYDLIVIVGGSHFNHPLPERILATLNTNGHLNGETQLIGIPIGPVTGPLSPHWWGSCDEVLVPNQAVVDASRRFSDAAAPHVWPELFAGIPKPVACPFNQDSDRASVLIDWTFIHNWQLKALLTELAEHQLRERIDLYLTTVSEETCQMLWAKWGALLEELTPHWVQINTDDYYCAVQSADVAVTFVCGRDIWVWRSEARQLIVCDFAGWWRAFGFEGPTPAASPKRTLAKLNNIVTTQHRSA